MMRGPAEVLDITPKEAVLTATPGLLNMAWLNALNSSARNSSTPLSRNPPTLVFFRMAISELNCPGPNNTLRPVLPYPVAPPTPFTTPMTGGVQNAEALKKLLKRDRTLPGVMTCE